MSRTLFVNGVVLLPSGFRTMDAAVDGGLISDIAPEIAPHAYNRVVDLEGDYLVPGFIDMHVHGGGGADVMDGTPEAILAVCQAHGRHGTTTLFPTTLTASDEDMDDFFRAFDGAAALQDREGLGGARIGGVHVEGPWLAPEQAGAQDPRYLRVPSIESCEHLLEKSDKITSVTLAPELPGARECAALLAGRGILPSMGHSNATLEQVKAGLDWGFRHMTHFYSAMSGMRRERGLRIPGMVEGGYLLDSVTVEAIADGYHLPLDLLDLIYKVKGPDKMALVTDAMRGAGQPEGPSILGSLKNGREVVVEGGVARLLDGSAFAGSVCTMDRAVKTVVAAGIPLEDALRMAAETPSKILGIQGGRGTIRVGLDADLVRLGKNSLEVRMTMAAGKVIFHGE